MNMKLRNFSIKNSGTAGNPIPIGYQQMLALVKLAKDETIASTNKDFSNSYFIFDPGVGESDVIYRSQITSIETLGCNFTVREGINIIQDYFSLEINNGHQLPGSDRRNAIYEGESLRFRAYNGNLTDNDLMYRISAWGPCTFSASGLTESEVRRRISISGDRIITIGGKDYANGNVIFKVEQGNLDNIGFVCPITIEAVAVDDINNAQSIQAYACAFAATDAKIISALPDEWINQNDTTILNVSVLGQVNNLYNPDGISTKIPTSITWSVGADMGYITEHGEYTATCNLDESTIYCTVNVNGRSAMFRSIIFKVARPVVSADEYPAFYNVLLNYYGLVADEKRGFTNRELAENIDNTVFMSLLEGLSTITEPYSFECGKYLTGVTEINITKATHRFGVGLTNLNIDSLKTISCALTNSFTSFEFCKDCVLLNSISMQNLESIEVVGAADRRTIYNRCFKGCTSLTKISLPKLKNLYDHPQSNYNLTMYSEQFEGCSKLETVNMPLLENIQDGFTYSSNNAVYIYTFANCSSLSVLNVPKLKRIGVDANTISLNLLYGGSIRLLENCVSIQEVNFPSLTFIGVFDNYMFRGCSNLKNISIGTPYSGNIQLYASYMFAELTKIGVVLDFSKANFHTFSSAYKWVQGTNIKKIIFSESLFSFASVSNIDNHSDGSMLKVMDVRKCNAVNDYAGLFKDSFGNLRLIHFNNNLPKKISNGIDGVCPIFVPKDSFADYCSDTEFSKYYQEDDYLRVRALFGKREFNNTIWKRYPVNNSTKRNGFDRVWDTGFSYSTNGYIYQNQTGSGYYRLYCISVPPQVHKIKIVNYDSITAYYQLLSTQPVLRTYALWSSNNNTLGTSSDNVLGKRTLNPSEEISHNIRETRYILYTAYNYSNNKNIDIGVYFDDESMQQHNRLFPDDMMEWMCPAVWSCTFEELKQAYITDNNLSDESELPENFSLEDASISIINKEFDD